MSERRGLRGWLAGGAAVAVLAAGLVGARDCSAPDSWQWATFVGVPLLVAVGAGTAISASRRTRTWPLPLAVALASGAATAIAMAELSIGECSL